MGSMRSGPSYLGSEYSRRITQAVADARRFIERAERVVGYGVEAEKWHKAEPTSGMLDNWYAEEPERKGARHAAMERARLDLRRSLALLANRRS